MRRITGVGFLAAVLVAATATPLRAQTILDIPPAPESDPAALSFGFLSTYASKFTVSQPLSLASFGAYLSGDGVVSYGVYTNGTNGPSDTALAASSVNLSGVTTPTLFTSTASAALSPGTYWFVMSETDGLGTATAYTNLTPGTNVRADTGLTPTFRNFASTRTAPAWNGTFGPIGSNSSLSYQIQAVPEPSTAVLAGILVAGGLVAARRRPAVPRGRPAGDDAPA